MGLSGISLPLGLPEERHGWEVHHLELVLLACPLDQGAVVGGQEEVEQELPQFHCMEGEEGESGVMVVWGSLLNGS